MTIGRRCVLKDCCVIEDNSVLSPETVVPTFARYSGSPGLAINAIPVYFLFIRNNIIDLLVGQIKSSTGKGDKWRPPTRARTFRARHLALWTFGARTIGALDNWHPGHFAPGHLAVGTIGALENWRSGTFGAQTFGAPDVWRPKKLPFS